jgi:hypothetical protein
MLDLIWNLFQDGDIECSRCSRSVLDTAVVCPFCGTRRKSGKAFDHA